MGVYLVGQVIKRTRESLGMTQEKLSDGICSVETLSRIETGKRAPSRANFVALMERMGKCGEKYMPFVHHQDIKVHRMLEKLTRYNLQNQYDKMERTLDELESFLNLNDSVNRQLIFMYRAMLDRNLERIEAEEYRGRITEALNCTVPAYKCDGILPKGIFTRTEIKLFISIAVSYILENNLDMAIFILEQLMEYHELTKIDIEEKVRVESSILNNLARCYGRKEEYERSKAIGIKNMNQCTKFMRMTNLPSTIYGIAYSMEHLNEEPDSCKELFIQAYYAAEQTDNKYLLNHIKAHIQKSYGEDVVKRML